MAKNDQPIAMIGYGGAVLMGVAHTAQDPTESLSNAASVIAIVFSAAMVESFMNELFSQTRDPVPSRGAAFGRLMTFVDALNLDADTERFDLQTKIQLTSISLRETPAEFANQPFQSLVLLTKVRNSVMHMRPKPIRFSNDVNYELEPHGLAVALCTAAGIKLADLDHPVTIPSIIRHPAVGAWAYRTAYEAVTEILSWVPKEAHGITGGIASLRLLYPPGQPKRPFPEGLMAALKPNQ